MIDAKNISLNMLSYINIKICFNKNLLNIFRVCNVMTTSKFKN